MFEAIIIIVSIIFQLLAIYAIFRLIKIFGIRSAWTLAVIAIILMILWHLGMLFHVIIPPPGPLSQFIVMVMSVAAGVSVLYIWQFLEGAERVRKELKSSEEKFKALAELSPNMIFINKGGRVVYANKRAVDEMGYAREEFYAPDFNFFSLIAPESLDIVKQSFSRHKQGANIGAYEYNLITKDGRRIAAEINTNLIPYEGEKAILGVVTDVTERKRAEIGVRESSERYKALLRAIPDAVTVSDLDGKITEVSEQTLALHGIKNASDIIGHSAFEFIAKTDHERAMEKLKDTLIKGVIKNAEYTMLRGDGSTFDGELSAAIVRGASGKPKNFIATVRDISEHKLMDRAKSEFVSLASHQLRTPLTTIAWFAEMILGGTYGKLNKSLVSPVTEIYDSNQRMIELVNALLNVARLESGALVVNPEPTDLAAVADNELKELAPQIAEKNIAVKKDYAELKNLMLDPALIGVVVGNLINNAVKYTPENGIIEISITKDEPNIIIAVKDNGIGIPKNQQSRIFQKLFRADNAQVSEPDGTGLGLYILKSILDETGGRVWLESEEGAGSTFYVSLPLTGMKAKAGTKSLIK